MAELSISPSFFGLHVYYWGDRHRELFLGPERAAYISPARAARDRGLHFTLHNDAPVVSNVSPLFIMWTAVNRLTSSGRILGKDQRISVLDSLRAVTIDAAWQVFLEKTRGSIEIGKYADLVVLDKNPLEHPATLKDIQVLETIVDGRSVFSKW
jgi:predicted amidohydrolase YtcJ